MATLTVTETSLTGTTSSPVSAGVSGDNFQNDGRTFLQVINGGGGSIDATIAKQVSSVTPPGFGAMSISDTVVAVAAGATKLIGPFPHERFDDANGRVQVTYSSVTSVTVQAIRVPVVN